MTTMRMVSVTVLLLVGMAVADASCPSGFSQYRHRCFQFFAAAAKNWVQSQLHCLSLGGTLASVHSAAENSFVRDLIKKQVSSEPVAWLGGFDKMQEKTWLWIDGTKFDWLNWHKGEPNNLLGREHCLVMNYGGTKQWNDHICSKRFSYVCATRL